MSATCCIVRARQKRSNCFKGGAEDARVCIPDVSIDVVLVLLLHERRSLMTYMYVYEVRKAPAATVTLRLCRTLLITWWNASSGEVRDTAEKMSNQGVKNIRTKVQKKQAYRELKMTRSFGDEGGSGNTH